LEKHADKITCQFPQGTYLAWLDCREMGISDKALRRFFVEKARLGLSPGVTFGKEGKGFMRLNFAVTSDIMDEALRRLEKALENFKPQEYA
jgi:cystathionine beta-lyase